MEAVMLDKKLDVFGRVFIRLIEAVSRAEIPILEQEIQLADAGT